VTEFEPYSQIFYGGYVDLVSGELTATWWGVTKKVSDYNAINTDTEGWCRYTYRIPANDVQFVRNANQMCSIAEYKYESNYYKPHFYTLYINNMNNIYLYLPEGIDTSTEFTVVSQL